MLIDYSPNRRLLLLIDCNCLKILIKTDQLGGLKASTSSSEPRLCLLQSLFCFNFILNNLKRRLPERSLALSGFCMD